ncbi:YkgJ family cysteine cluster protein [Poseidonibacter sp.]|uniref:YkgJ family cysteine cluster protein n=1 Tax=Poseidonibacter sp. TaxID=2321188 RepID=UPI003C73F56B
MKQFTNIKDKKITFSSCDICLANCCDGKKGTTFSQILKDDFSSVYKNFSILFIFGELGFCKPVIILTNGQTYCKYLENFKCIIYENRPSICKLYPLSANIDNNIYFDENCPAINNNLESTIISQNNQINKEFFHNNLDNYQDKYIDTFREFEKFDKNEDFTLAIQLNGMQFFKFSKNSDNEYMQMHQKSLIHLQDRYFKDLMF